MKRVLRIVRFLGSQVRAEYGVLKSAFVEWADEEEAMDYHRTKPLVQVLS